MRSADERFGWAEGRGPAGGFVLADACAAWGATERVARQWLAELAGLATERGWCLAGRWQGGRYVYRLYAPGEGALALDAAQHRRDVLRSYHRGYAPLAEFTGSRVLIEASRGYREADRADRPAQNGDARAGR